MPEKEIINNKQLINKGGWISLAIGLPVGIFTTCCCLMFPGLFLKEGLTLIAYAGLLKISTIGLIIAFIFSLFIAGRIAANDVLKKKHLLLISLKYTLMINIVIWSTYFLLFLYSNQEPQTINLIVFVFTVILFFICVVITHFTIGLFICYMIKKLLENF